MTHRLQVRVDRQITPRPGRNITRKWVYERSFSVHLFNTRQSKQPLGIQFFFRSAYLTALLACCVVFLVCIHLVLTLMPVLFRLQHFPISTGLSCRHKPTFFMSLAVCFLGYFRALSTPMAVFCFTATEPVSRCNVGSLLFVCS